ncbi:cytochrome P450 [Amycolatopsis sp. cg5]|uniref:cytochrome P450 n=1 Tax=Amycolatopsis sp. cg5 TaxID=3238802 RepID=UPI0035244ECD
MSSPHTRYRRAALLESQARLALDSVRGDPCASLLRLKPSRDGHRHYDAIRRRSELVASRRGLLFTASHPTARQVLRSDAFGARLAGSPKRPAQGERQSVHPLDDAFLRMDPPHHTELRAQAGPPFARNRLTEIDGYLGEVIEHCLDRFPAGEPIDLIARFAETIPLWTTCRILGLPVEDAPRFASWARLFARLLDGPRSVRDCRLSDAAVAEMSDYFRARIEAPHPSRAALIDDLARRCPVDLDVKDAIATCEMLLLGGFATTVNLMGNTLHTLLRDPGLRPSSGDYLPIVEESLRFDSPVQYTVRVAKVDTEVAGQLITARTPVVVLLAAANRDPDVFAHPDVFTPGRANARSHLAFGAGIHFCLGSALSLHEVTVAVRRLFDRYPDLVLAGKPQRLRSRVLRGFSRLPVIAR